MRALCEYQEKLLPLIQVNIDHLKDISDYTNQISSFVSWLSHFDFFILVFLSDISLLILTAD